jgi:hypothetical protein
MAIRSRVRAGICAGLVFLLTGCNDVDKQKRLAVGASQVFQALYNSGSCRQIYDNASRYFQAHETPSRWMRDCTDLQARFGALSEFEPASNNNWPFGRVGIVWVRGPAKFVHAAADVRLDWDLSQERPALFNVLIESGGVQTSIPGFTGEIRN